MQSREKKDNLITALGLFSSMFFILILIPVFYGATIHFMSIMNQIADTNQKLFFIALYIAIISVLSQWIDGRLKYIIENVKLTLSKRKKEKEVKNEQG